MDLQSAGKLQTAGPTRKNLRRDCQAWPESVADLVDDVDALIDENRRLEAEVERLRELQSATRRYIEYSGPGITPYIKENGRHGKSPWAELIEAAEAAEAHVPSPVRL